LLRVALIDVLDPGGGGGGKKTSDGANTELFNHLCLYLLCMCCVCIVLACFTDGAAAYRGIFMCPAVCRSDLCLLTLTSPQAFSGFSNCRDIIDHRESMWAYAFLVGVCFVSAWEREDSVMRFGHRDLCLRIVCSYWFSSPMLTHLSV